MEYWYSPHFIDENTKKIIREFNLHILNIFIGKFLPKFISISASEIHAPINPFSRLWSSGGQESPSNTYWVDDQWIWFWWLFTGTGRDKQVLHISCQMSLRTLFTPVPTTTLYMDHLHQNYLEFFVEIHISVLHGIRNSEAETQIFAVCKYPWKTKDHRRLQQRFAKGTHRASALASNRSLLGRRNPGLNTWVSVFTESKMHST